MLNGISKFFKALKWFSLGAWVLYTLAISAVIIEDAERRVSNKKRYNQRPYGYYGVDRVGRGE